MTFVVLIADAGPEAGMGHLSRCSSLALALRRQGARVKAIGLGLDAQAERYGVRWELATDLPPAGADAIVIDSYRATGGFRAALASAAPVVAFSDDSRALPEASLVVRSGSAASREGELAGPSYACLGPEFWSVSPRRPSPRVERVLVTTGAGDHTNAGPPLARGLSDALPEAHVALVRGPFAPATDGLDRIRTISAPASLFDALAGADIVVSAAGQTMLEALAAGAPCVALITAQNQMRQAIELRSASTLFVARSVDEAVDAACELAADFSLRHRLARAGQAAVDGRGAIRTAAAVLELVRKRQPA